MPDRDDLPELSATADAELDLILLDSLLEWGPHQADTYRRDFENAFRSIATFPDSGTFDEDLPPGFRLKFVGVHVICYEIIDSSVFVHRIVDQRRDRSSLFSRSD